MAILDGISILEFTSTFSHFSQRIYSAACKEKSEYSRGSLLAMEDPLVRDSRGERASLETAPSGGSNPRLICPRLLYDRNFKFRQKRRTIFRSALFKQARGSFRVGFVDPNESLEPIQYPAFSPVLAPRIHVRDTTMWSLSLSLSHFLFPPVSDARVCIGVGSTAPPPPPSPPPLPIIVISRYDVYSRAFSGEQQD